MRYLTSSIVRRGAAGLLATTLALSLAGCGATGAANGGDIEAEERILQSVSDAPASATDATQATDDTVMTAWAPQGKGIVDTTDLFTDRDLSQVADTTDATTITLASGQDVQISEEGTYVISGEASDVTIVVDVLDSDKVQLVLAGASISNADAPAIYVKNADKVFVTTAEGTINTLQVTGSFVADGDTNTDAVIFSRDDLVLGGLGLLQVVSTDNGITSKDDLKVTGGTYTINVAADALEANDSILVCGGDFSITAGKDGLHCENDEDDTQGLVYLCGGSFDIDAASDGIQATTVLQIDDGSFDISAGECLEATYVQVNGGNFTLEGTDDGINASYKSASVGTPTLEITGGTLSITMAQGDTDALDSNGDLVVSGGQIDIYAQFAFDFDGTASFTGGSITVNGQQVSEITNSMMMGGPDGMGGPGGMGMMGGPGGGMGPGGMGGPGTQG